MTAWRMTMVILTLAVACAAWPAQAVTHLPAEAACAAEAAANERLQGIPERLLHAISLVESGRFDADRRATIAWPWTVMAEGEGRYLPSKDAAIAEVRRLKARGVRNIDVGCMQVNLRYHPDAFASLEEAFDPAANVAYAARFLKGLYDATGHWPTAASYYHSQTPSLAEAYRTRLMKVWRGVQTEFAALTGGRRPAAAPAVAEVDEADEAPAARPRLRQEVEREEAAQIADAYRQARLSEYQARRLRFAEARATTPGAWARR